MNRFPLFLVLVLLTSCLREVDLEVEQIPHLLVVNCFFTEGEAFRVNVSRLAAYTDLTNRSIADARVTITSNGKYTGTLIHTGKGNYTNPSVVPEPGKLYQLTVEAEGYPMATAQDSLPLPVFVDSVIFTPKAGKFDDGIDYNQYSVWFRDIPGKTWYTIQVMNADSSDGEWSYGGFEIFSTDPVISAEGMSGEDLKRWFAFSDTLFSNQLYGLKINLGDSYSQTDKARILLVSGTFPYYQFLKRLLKHEPYSSEDPFKPYNPVPLYSNIKNGLGIFAGFRCQPYDLDIQNPDKNE